MKRQSLEGNGFEQYEFITLGTACDVCKALDGKYFDVKKMMPGENAPPMYPNCRCSTAAHMNREEYDAWLDYLDKGGTTEEWSIRGKAEWKSAGNHYKKHGKMNLKDMRLSLPGDVLKIRGMTPEGKKEIEKAIKKLQKEYKIDLNEIELAKLGKGTIFSVDPYVAENGILKFNLVINEDIDYNKIKGKMEERYAKRIFAGKSIEDYIAHEMTHIMTYQDCKNEREYRTKKTIIDKQFIKGLSKYSDRCENGEETIAEAFVRYRNGEKIPLNAEILVRSNIERWKK